MLTEDEPLPPLLPCPFCDGGGLFPQAEPFYGRLVHQILCSGCGTLGPTGKTEREAFERWNIRPVFEPAP